MVECIHTHAWFITSTDLDYKKLRSLVARLLPRNTHIVCMYHSPILYIAMDQSVEVHMSLVIIAYNKLGYPAKEPETSLSHNYNHKHWISYIIDYYYSYNNSPEEGIKG